MMHWLTLEVLTPRRLNFAQRIWENITSDQQTPRELQEETWHGPSAKQKWWPCGCSRGSGGCWKLVWLTPRVVQVASRNCCDYLRVWSQVLNAKSKQNLLSCTDLQSLYHHHHHHHHRRQQQQQPQQRWQQQQRRQQQQQQPRQQQQQQPRQQQQQPQPQPRRRRRQQQQQRRQQQQRQQQQQQPRQQQQPQPQPQRRRRRRRRPQQQAQQQQQQQQRHRKKEQTWTRTRTITCSTAGREASVSSTKYNVVQGHLRRIGIFAQALGMLQSQPVELQQWLRCKHSPLEHSRWHNPSVQEIQ